MTRAAHNTLPPRMTVAEARRIITDPQLAAATHWVVREQAWQMVKAVWMVRRARAGVAVLQPHPTTPKGAA